MKTILIVALLALACSTARSRGTAGPGRPEIPHYVVSPESFPPLPDGMPPPTPIPPGTTPPKLISGPVPQYTDEALRANARGVVVVDFVIRVDGHVTGCRVVGSTVPMMNGAVVGALEKRVYEPARRDGQPIEITYRYTARFTGLLTPQ